MNINSLFFLGENITSKGSFAPKKKKSLYWTQCSHELGLPNWILKDFLRLLKTTTMNVNNHNKNKNKTKKNIICRKLSLTLLGPDTIDLFFSFFFLNCFKSHWNHVHNNLKFPCALLLPSQTHSETIHRSVMNSPLPTFQKPS